jgi:hypothetical protein
VHLFWLSHVEKRPWLELSMGGGPDRSWSSMGGTMGELAGEGRGEGEGETGQLGAWLGWGRHGGCHGGADVRPACVLLWRAIT